MDLYRADDDVDAKEELHDAAAVVAEEPLEERRSDKDMHVNGEGVGGDVPTTGTDDGAGHGDAAAVQGNGGKYDGGANGHAVVVENGEKEPLRSKEEKKADEESQNICVMEIANEECVPLGGAVKEVKTADDGAATAKKVCDVRCIVIGVLVFIIMIGGTAVAVLAHRFKGTL